MIWVGLREKIMNKKTATRNILEGKRIIPLLDHTECIPSFNSGGFGRFILI